MQYLDPDRVVPDESRSIADGAIEPWGKPGGPYHRTMVRALSEKLEVPLDVPWKELPKKTRTLVLQGKKAGYEGVLGHYHVQTNKSDPGPALQWDLILGEARALLAQDAVSAR